MSASLRRPRLPDPKPRPTISRERVRVIAHQVVDQMAGINPVVYFHLNQHGDLPTLVVYLTDWMDSQGVEMESSSTRPTQNTLLTFCFPLIPSPASDIFSPAWE